LLGLSAAVWLPYGLYCFLDPAVLGSVAGVTFASATGSTEIRAMYGGLQMGVGVLSVLGLLRIEWRTAALRALLVLVGSLLVSRLAGVVLDGSLSAYTVSALALEGAGTAAAAWVLRTESTLI
jgi:hypothetical protein